ncbi:MAG: alpha/beta fold hydrolase [Verrucomicrobiales bacterium]|nr:alpha/beta fold hydrolase [Verrucomicrobiales bacterium]MCP5556933.1 alpha/beta fold hydrolase [Verrucomicrobiaceae bacterium]
MFQRLKTLFFVLLPIFAVAVLLLSWWAGTDLAQPTRRVLQDYHRDFLKEPGLHGVKITPFETASGAPCLMLSPIASGTLGPRGEKVRAQVALDGQELGAPGQIRGTLVLLHGRHGRKEDYLLIAERFCAVGFRCLIPDLPGHGDHPEKVAGFGQRESGLPKEVLTTAAGKFGFEPGPAGLMGLSMGGAVAVQAAAADPGTWEALIVVSSFDRLITVVEHQANARVGSLIGRLCTWGTEKIFGWRAGVPLREVQSVETAAKLTLPTLIAHGTADGVIPLSSGKALYAALTMPDKQWIEIPKANHDNVLITDFPIYATMAEWFLRWVR